MKEKTRLQLAREAAGLTKTELAELSGVTRQTIHNVECGADCKVKATAKKLCAALKITGYDVFGF